MSAEGLAILSGQVAAVILHETAPAVGIVPPRHNTNVRHVAAGASGPQAPQPPSAQQRTQPMPDIAMCWTPCPRSADCRRSPDSGTVPSERQSWTAGTPSDDCPIYLPVKDSAP